MVLGMTTKSKRRKALETLPPDLYKSFTKVIARIRESSVDQAELGLKVLMWLHFARRPLKLVELQHALAVENSHTEFDADNIPSKKALLDCCLGLVVVDDETLTVRFVHYTLEEYFRDNANTEFPNGCIPIAETCLTYLNFGKLRQHCMDDRGLKENINKYALLNYATAYWGTYVKQQCSDSLMELVKIIAHEFECSSCAMQAFYQHLHPWSSIPQKISGIHAIAYFGLSEIMAHFCQVGRNMELKDDLGWTPLIWAAMNGQEAVVRLLIERDDVDINAKDRDGRTPLIFAVVNGHEAVARLLIERDDVDINAKDSIGWTPLICAAKSGHEAVVRLLIERDDVDINARGGTYGQTPLIYAASYGHMAVVRLLIERDDVDINAKDSIGQTPLICAAKSGHEAVVWLLIERDDVDINAEDIGGQSVLTLAAKVGYSTIVRLLKDRLGMPVTDSDQSSDGEDIDVVSVGGSSVSWS